MSAGREPALRWEARRGDPRYPGARTLAPATAALPAGFAIAEITGVRALGGAVLAALAVAAVLASGSSRARRGLWLALLTGLFVASHVIADPVGTWAAVTVVTVAAGVAAFWVLRPQPAAPSS